MAEASSSGIGGFIGNSLGEAAAFAAGLAIGPVLRPYLQELENETWAGTPTRPLDAALMAQGVAEGKIAAGAGAGEAALTGISASAFASLVTVLKQAPGIATGLELIRRGQLSPTDFVTVLQRNGLEDQFVTAYQALAVNQLEPWEAPLSPADIALGIVRSTLPSQGLLVVDLDTSGSNVAQYTPASLDVIAEAAASGMDKERLRTLVGNVGLPLATEAAARAQFRGIITKGAFYQAILEGDTRPEWADTIYETAREILTSHEYAELYLRGWLTLEQMYAGTALHGMSEADSDNLVKNIGRPIVPHQVTTGLARGGTFGGYYEGVPEPYLSSIRQSNVRPEWGNLDYANRFTYPSGFQIKAEAPSDGEAFTEDLLLKIGWEPTLAKHYATKWAASSATSAGTNTHVKSALTAVVSAAKKAFLAGTLPPEAATTTLEAAGLSPADTASILAQWELIAKIEGVNIDTAGGTPT